MKSEKVDAVQVTAGRVKVFKGAEVTSGEFPFL
jgi:hypothetical protein